MSMEIEDALERTLKSRGFSSMRVSAEVDIGMEETTVEFEIYAYFDRFHEVSITAIDEGGYWKGEVIIWDRQGQSQEKKFKIKSEATVDAEEICDSILKAIKGSKRLCFDLKGVRTK